MKRPLGFGARAPVTPQGLERSKKARWVHGFYSIEAKEQRRIECKGLRQLIHALRAAASMLVGPQKRWLSRVAVR